MDVLADTCIWSVAVRRRSPDLVLRSVLDDLIARSRLGMVGAIRQECLSGLTDPNHYDRIRTLLRVFPDIPLIDDDYELAASFYNACRSKGIQGSHTDFLICAVADRQRLLIFTTDKDFDRYAKIIPIRRFVP